MIIEIHKLRDRLVGLKYQLVPVLPRLIFRPSTRAGHEQTHSCTEHVNNITTLMRDKKLITTITSCFDTTCHPYKRENISVHSYSVLTEVMGIYEISRITQTALFETNEGSTHSGLVKRVLYFHKPEISSLDAVL